MSYQWCSIMLVQLQGYIIADIKVHYNIILMYVYNVYLGISFPPQFPDDSPSISYISPPILYSDRPCLGSPSAGL